jgi:imidazolonepropionase-like amidohydrolase
MTRSLILTAGMLAALAALPGATASVTNSQTATRLGPSRGAMSTGTFAIRNVNVITMASAGTVRSATILVRDGRIAAVGSGVPVPAGTRIIDGTGKFVIPGLTDMHTHLFSWPMASPSRD